MKEEIIRQRIASSHEFANEKKYWQNTISGDLEQLYIPTINKTNNIDENNVTIKRYVFSSHISDQLLYLSNGSYENLFAIMLSGLNYLLYRYSNEQNIMIGSPIQKQEREEHYINTMLVYKNQITHQLSFKDFLLRVKEIINEATENQNYPVDMLIKEIYPNLALNEVIQVIALLDNIHDNKYVEHIHSNMTLKFSECNDTIELEIIYNNCLYIEKVVDRIYRHLDNIFEQIVNDININLDDMEILSEEESKRILNDFNNTDIDFPLDKTAFQLFEEQVKKTPDKIAVVFEDKGMTYEALNNSANKVGHYLREKGIRPNEIVSIVLERSMDMIITILGILKAGAAYLPIDPEYPDTRIKYMLENSHTKLVLCHDQFIEKLDFFGDVVDVQSDSIAKMPIDNLKHLNNPADLAYVIYTSGSTGMPKGAMVEHVGMMNHLQAKIRDLHLHDNSRIAQNASYCFDISVWQFFAGIIIGGTTVIYAKDKIIDLDIFVEKIIKDRITILEVVPSVLAVMLDKLSNVMLKDLVYLLVTGEEIKKNLVIKWFEKFPGIQMVNAYGPTEASDDITHYIMNQVPKNNVIPIGKPIPNMKIYIVDDKMRLCPIGVKGEVVVSGIGVGKGYINDQLKTDASFGIDPFKNEKTRLYKTGDLGRWLEDGNIEFLGRKDHQVKIRGFRIELGEIERILLNISYIKEAIVIEKADDKGNKFLCGYCTSYKDIKYSEIKEELASELPYYMIPAHVIRLENMPLNSNGKVDRKILDSIVLAVKRESSTNNQPVDELDSQLVALCEEILEIDDIELDEDFFDIGGHSLNATVLISKIHEKFNVEFTLKQLFIASTIKEIADFIRENKTDKFLSIKKVSKANYYETSSAQKRMYALEQFNEKGTNYNISSAYVIKGIIDKNYLEEIFNSIIKRHEILRTSFDIIDNEIVQVVNENIKFEIEDINSHNPKEAIKYFIKPFNLSEAPLLRAGMITVSDNEHILFLDMHHIISDGTSGNILIKEFIQTYSQDNIDDLKIQYKDYAHWHNQLLKTDSLKSQEQYWLNKLGEDLPVINLPYDYKRQRKQSFKGKTITFNVEGELYSELKNISNQTGSTLFMILLSAYSILLSKYSGQEDIIIGSPIAGRRHVDTQELIGIFVNTLAIRNYPKGNMQYVDYLKEVKENCLSAYENQDYPFEEIVERLDIQRDVSRNPIFDVLFVLQNMQKEELALEDIIIEPYEFDEETIKFDLALSAIELKENIVLNLEYCEALFKHSTVKRLSEHFINILKNLVKNPNVLLKDIDLLTEKEKELFFEYDKTISNDKTNKTICSLFNEQVEKSPHQIAVVYNENKLTYKELNERSNRIAQRLTERGLYDNGVVGLLMDRSVEMIVGIMGILKAGLAYMPIRPDYPLKRIRYMLEDCNIKSVLTQKCIKDKMLNQLLGYDLINIDEDAHNMVKKSSANIKGSYCASDVAYIIYTSGSTGNPKGVTIENNSIVNLVEGLKKAIYDMHKGNLNIALTAPIVFDASIKQIFSSILAGHTLHIVPEEARFDGTQLLDFYHDHNIHIADGTPAHLKIILNKIKKYQKDIDVEHFIIGGEALKTSLIKEFYDSYTGEKPYITNVYGPTECCDVATTYLINPNDLSEIEIVPIGTPLLNYKVHILGRNDEVLPRGAIGELCISGQGLARGYINNGELTKSKFICNQYLNNQRMYKTGDAVRLMDDGNIQYIGRIDHQVKIRGVRIELGEIETAILKYGSVKEAKVLVKENQNEEKFIIGYVIADEEIEYDKLKQTLLSELPHYMVPNNFVQIDEMPITSNGKVDKKKLLEIKESMQMTAIYEEARNQIDEKLIAIWKDVLRLNSIGINDNFFELDGHSLKAISVITKINKLFNVHIVIQDIFRFQTIKELSDYIKVSECKNHISIEPIQKEFYEVSSAQKRMYMMHQFNLQNTAYNMPVILEVEGSLDIDKVKNTFIKLINRHAILRTSFKMDDEKIVQIIHNEVTFDVDFVKGNILDIDGEIEKFVKPFALDVPPLLRVKLNQISKARSILMIDMHHIIADGVSNKILIEEFQKLYNGDELETLRIQYKDYSVWQNKFMNSEEMIKQERYWINQLEGVEETVSIPTDYQRSGEQSFEGDSYTLAIDQEIMNRLGILAKETSSTVYMIFLSALNILISKYTHTEDVVIGTPVAGRNHADLENIIGIFVNTLAIRNYPKSSLKFIEFLNEVKRNSLEALENQQYQYEILIEKLEITRDTSSNPLFDIMLVMDNEEKMDIKLDQLVIKNYEQKKREALFDLTFLISENAHKCEVEIEYKTKLFKEETIAKIGEHFINIIQAVTDNFKIQIGDIEVLSKAERDRILYAFNNTAEEFKLKMPVNTLFEKQVELTPNNIAVVFEEKQLTYAELNSKANIVAAILKEKGVGAESIIGIMVERSVEMMIGLLAILKAGGAFLPIDPDYPEERINFIIQDSKIKIMLTQCKYMKDIACNIDCIDIMDKTIYLNEKQDNIICQNSIDDLAYVIYTSGTTGYPKGVLIEHKNLLAYLNAFYREIELTSFDTIIQQASFSFDTFIEEVFPILLKGGKVVIIKKEDVRDPLKLIQHLKKEQVTIVSFSPLLLNELNALEPVKSIHTYISAGDVFKEEYVSNLIKYGQVYNYYGPTEATVSATCYKVNTKVDEVVSIGKPIENYRAYILDKNLKPVPIGVEGELFLAGEGIARGYLNRTSLTIEKFIENPYIRNERMYKTGDIARWLPDENIQFIGRRDDQVSIRGYRIELAEIEKYLVEFYKIKEAAVCDQEDKNGMKYLVAYLVLNESLEIDEVREYLRSKVPDYMIPLQFNQLDKMPVTHNGKIDKKCLDEYSSPLVRSAKYEVPTNKTEEKLAEIWREVLELSTISVNDNFFDLGGYSLKIMFMISKIHNVFDVRVEFKDVFEFDTIRSMAEYIDKSNNDYYTAIEPIEKKPYYESSSAQKRMFYIQQLDQESRSYNVPIVLEIEGSLDEIRLEKSLNKMVMRHESLRTSFDTINGEVVQIVHENTKVVIERNMKISDKIDDCIQKFIRPFDLTLAPLMRAGIMSLDTRKHLLMLDMHHIITDGISMNIFVEEFTKIYQGEDLVDIDVHYKDYVVWHKNNLSEEKLALQEKYWLERFSGQLPILNMPLDYKRSNLQSYEGGELEVILPPILVDKLRNLAKSNNCTLYMVLLSALNILCHKYSNQEDIIIGTPSFGRPTKDVEKIIGLFINTLAIRNYPHEDKKYQEFLLEVKEQTMYAYENQDYQFEQLIKQLNVPVDRSRNPLFDIIFTYDSGEISQEITMENMQIKPYEHTFKNSKVDIVFDAYESESSIIMNITYCNKLYRESTIERMMKHLLNIMEYITDNSHVLIKNIYLIDLDEKKVVVDQLDNLVLESTHEATFDF